MGGRIGVSSCQSGADQRHAHAKRWQIQRKDFKKEKKNKGRRKKQHIRRKINSVEKNCRGGRIGVSSCQSEPDQRHTHAKRRQVQLKDYKKKKKKKKM